MAFKGASLDEVKAVTGHEIGHYVLHHVWRTVAVFSALAILFFFLADRLFPRFARAFGSTAALADPAGLPVLLFMLSVFAVLAEPVVNTLSRIDETESDRYSLETVEPARCARLRAGQDGGIPQSAAAPAAGNAVLHASVGGAARADGDGVEGGGGHPLRAAAVAGESLSARRRILPMLLLGRSSRNSMIFGFL